MKVTLVLVGRPAGASPELSGSTWALPEGSRLEDLLALAGLAESREIIAIQDGVPAGADTPLHDGAEIRLIPMVDGG